MFRFETQGTTMRDTIDGSPYVGQRFEFSIYPRRGGELEIPPAVVTLLDREGNEIGTTQGQTLHQDISVPEGVDPSQPAIAARRLTVVEQWTPDPSTAFTAGDALTRIITRTAEDVPSLAMRDLAFTAPSGVRVYRDPPQSDDHIDRGVVTGHRVDRATYVFETAGSFRLPAVSQPWWDLASNALRTEEGGGVSVTVSAAPTAAPGTGSPGQASFWRQPSNSLILVAVLGGIVGIFFVFRHTLPVWRAALIRYRRQREQSEEKAFRDLLAACQGGDPRAAYRAFGIWRMRLPPATADAAAEPAHDLERVLYSPERGNAEWSPERARTLVQTLRAARPALLRPANTTAIRALPPLNPPRSV
ncbi:MAG: hypothetical protein AB7T18_09645 [Alphaproteobacteria bacterium]